MTLCEEKTKKDNSTMEQHRKQPPLKDLWNCTRRNSFPSLAGFSQLQRGQSSRPPFLGASWTAHLEGECERPPERPLESGGWQAAPSCGNHHHQRQTTMLIAVQVFTFDYFFFQGSDGLTDYFFKLGR
jgi:hypothetical protein